MNPRTIVRLDLQSDRRLLPGRLRRSMSPNTEREYRRVTDETELLRGDSATPPELCSPVT